MQRATQSTKTPQAVTAEDPAKILEDVWGYYMPEPQLVATPREAEDTVTPTYYAAA